MATFRRHQRAEALAELNCLEQLATSTEVKPRAVMPLLLRRTVPLPPASVLRVHADGEGAAAGGGGPLALAVESTATSFSPDWKAFLSERSSAPRFTCGCQTNTTNNNNK